MPNPDARRLEQIHDLATNYSDRQGLRIVPMALVILAQSNNLFLNATILGTGVALPLLVAGVLSYFLIGKAYERYFGRIEELPASSMSLGKQFLLFLPLLFGSVAADIRWNSHVFFCGLLISVWIAANAWPARTVRNSYLGFSLLLALVCLLPMAGYRTADVARFYGSTFGSFFLMAGIADHFRLVRLLTPKESDEQATV